MFFSLIVCSTCTRMHSSSQKHAHAVARADKEPKLCANLSSLDDAILGDDLDSAVLGAALVLHKKHAAERACAQGAVNGVVV